MIRPLTSTNAGQGPILSVPLGPARTPSISPVAGYTRGRSCSGEREAAETGLVGARAFPPTEYVVESARSESPTVSADRSRTHLDPRFPTHLCWLGAWWDRWDRWDLASRRGGPPDARRLNPGPREGRQQVMTGCSEGEPTARVAESWDRSQPPWVERTEPNPGRAEVCVLIQVLRGALPVDFTSLRLRRFEGIAIR